MKKFEQLFVSSDGTVGPGPVDFTRHYLKDMSDSELIFRMTSDKPFTVYADPEGTAARSEQLFRNPPSDVMKDVLGNGIFFYKKPTIKMILKEMRPDFYEKYRVFF